MVEKYLIDGDVGNVCGHGNDKDNLKIRWQ